MFPLILAAIGATKAIDAAVNYIGQRKAGEAAFKQGSMERDIYGKNADLATKQAEDATARGEEASLRQSYKMRTLQGSQVSALAGQGITLAGTTGGVIRDDQALGEADRQQILENARREAWGYTQQASIYKMRGDLVFQAGKNKRSEEDLASIGTLANFGGDMFDLFKKAS